MTNWAYKDWITYDKSDPQRLSRLRLHIVEVSEKITANVNVGDKTHDISDLRQYLHDLHEREAEESALGEQIAVPAKRASFTRARLRPW